MVQYKNKPSLSKLAVLYSFFTASVASQPYPQLYLRRAALDLESSDFVTSGDSIINHLKAASVKGSASPPAKNSLWAVVHIGPALTGTSAIHKSLEIVDDHLVHHDRFEDAFYHAMKYTSKGPNSDPSSTADIRNFIGCFRQDPKQHDSASEPSKIDMSCDSSALKQIEQVSSKRSNSLIISSDLLSDPMTDVSTLHQFLQASWENHKVVGFYRRYYDWLLSFYDELHKNSGENNPETRQPISEFIEEEFENQYLYKNLYVSEAIDRYRESFPYVEIINMYEINDIRTAFYCQALVGGNITASCRAFQKYYQSNIETEVDYFEKGYYNHESKRTAENRANYVYNDLVFYAKRQGFLDINTVTDDVIMAAKNYQENILKKSSIEFHYSTVVCPRSKHTNGLLARSKEIESRLFPDYYNRQGKVEIEQHYDHLRRTYHLCHIDAEAVLDMQPEWVAFFQSYKKATGEQNSKSK